MAERILLIGPTPPPTGGIASHLIALAAALARVGVPTRIVDPHDRMKFATEIARAGMGESLAHLHVPGHNPKDYAVIGACVAARATPLVTLHSGLAPEFFASLGRTGRIAVTRILGATAGVVCVSEKIAAALRAIGVDADHLTVATPFISQPRQVSLPPAHVAGARKSTKTLIAAAVAPGPEYGADILVAGFAALATQRPEAVLVVFGPGGADLAVAQELAQRGLGDRVIAAGELVARTALAVMAQADVFVRATRADGDALSVREARALGVRVVASDVSARPPGTTLFAAGDWRDLAAAMGRALDAPPPAATREDGFAPLYALYSRLGAPKEIACAASPAG